MRDGFMEQVTALAERYTPLLAEQGVTCTVSKRYFQTEVPYRTTDSDIFGAIDHYLDKRRERRYQGYRNRYHCVILRFSPTEKGAVKKENCREYAFLLHKVERPHKGVAPEEKTYDEQKALAKIEKRLQKMLKKAKAKAPIDVCKDTWEDALFRYTLAAKYGYKQRILGKERYTIEILSVCGFVVICLAIVILLYLL